MKYKGTVCFSELHGRTVSKNHKCMTNAIGIADLLPPQIQHTPLKKKIAEMHQPFLFQGSRGRVVLEAR